MQSTVGKILTEDRINRREIFSNLILSTINPTWTGLWSKPGQEIRHWRLKASPKINSEEGSEACIWPFNKFNQLTHFIILFQSTFCRKLWLVKCRMIRFDTRSRQLWVCIKKNFRNSHLQYLVLQENFFSILRHTVTPAHMCATSWCSLTLRLMVRESSNSAQMLY